MFKELFSYFVGGRMQRLLPITTRSNRQIATLVTKRHVSKGSLGGGFTKQGLQQFGKRTWEQKNETKILDDPYADLFHIKISVPCSAWLDSHNDPSAELGRAYFGSPRFYPERMLLWLLSPFLFDTMHLPQEFRKGDSFLVWEVASKSPLELICSWNLGNIKGLTMVAFDPKLRRLYHGNCIDSVTSESSVFKTSVPLHSLYAKYLLGGMKNMLENKVNE